MPWRDKSCGGFPDASANTLPRPIIEAGPFGVGAVNAAAQQRDPTPLLAWVRRLCGIRRSGPEIGWGGMSIIESDDPAVFALCSRHDGRSSIIPQSLDDKQRHSELKLDKYPTRELTEFLGNKIHEGSRTEDRVRDLDPYGYRCSVLIHTG